jgi:hypothetical protein
MFVAAVQGYDLRTINAVQGNFDPKPRLLMILTDRNSGDGLGLSGI